MRKAALACLILTIAGCKKEPPAPPPAPPAPPPANWAGQWNAKGMNAAGDSIVGYVFTATATDSGWSLTFPNRPPVAVTVVHRAGDSVVVNAGPYESALRRGVQVTTNSTWHMAGDSIHGTTQAHYSRGPDTLLTITGHGARRMMQ